jgi:hypothetical protein
LLVLNKDTTTNFNAQIDLGGFVPAAAAMLRSFGIPQDEAARTNGTLQAQDIATNAFDSASGTFNYSFAPLSMTLITFSPTAPILSALPTGASGGSDLLLLHGQPGVRYCLQSSADLATWTTVSTNTLAGSTMNFTNAAPADGSPRFWRALWQP